MLCSTFLYISLRLRSFYFLISRNCISDAQQKTHLPNSLFYICNTTLINNTTSATLAVMFQNLSYRQTDSVAMRYAKKIGASIVSIVSRNGGAALRFSDVCVLIPVISQENITPHAEGWQPVLWHLIVNAIQ